MSNFSRVKELKSFFKGELNALQYDFSDINIEYNYWSYNLDAVDVNLNLSQEVNIELLIIKHFEILGERETQDQMLIKGGIDLEINGIKYLSKKSIILSQHVIVIPFFINENVYLLVFSGFNFKITAVINIQNDNYVDVIHKKVNKPPIHNKLFRDRFNEMFYSHITKFKFELCKYFREPSIGVGLIVGAAHLGHSLWNDISGLERGYKKGLLNRARAVVILKGSDPFELVPFEFNFRIDLGIVRKTSMQWHEQIANFYYNNFFWLRLTDNIIYSSIKSRLLSDIPNDDFFSVTFGLRLENRTWVNQVEGWKKIIQFLSTKKKNIKIYIDGHNINSELEKLKSSGETDNDDIFEKELDIYRELRESAPKNVKIISCIGMTLRDNIKKIADSKFFIAPWGAGLAKYSWACGLDGIVMTNQWNLLHREDLHIYNSSSYLEEVPDLMYLESKYVSEEDDSSQIVRSDLAQKQNFIVDIDGLLKLVDLKMEKL